MSERDTSIEPLELLNRLVAIVPDFKQYWELPDNYFHEDDGTFTVCGAFIEFSHFALDCPDAFAADSMQRLAALLSECMNGSSELLHTSAGTCFLENVAYEPFADRLMPFLYGEPLRFLSQFSN
jgi:hypothetical protein